MEQIRRIAIIYNNFDLVVICIKRMKRKKRKFTEKKTVVIGIGGIQILYIYILHILYTHIHNDSNINNRIYYTV